MTAFIALCLPTLSQVIYKKATVSSPITATSIFITNMLCQFLRNWLFCSLECVGWKCKCFNAIFQFCAQVKCTILDVNCLCLCWKHWRSLLRVRCVRCVCVCVSRRRVSESPVSVQGPPGLGHLGLWRTGRTGVILDPHQHCSDEARTDSQKRCNVVSVILPSLTDS